MRMPLGGGDGQVVLSVDGGLDFHCATRPGTACVLIRRGPDAEVVSLLDPIKGVETEVVRTGSQDGAATISPDGRHIGFLLKGNPGNRIRVANLHGVTQRLVTVTGTEYLASLDWDAAGSGFFTTDIQPSTSRLLHVGLDGTIHVLMVQAGGIPCWAIASPNGRQIATFKQASSSNVWMIENP
jgi:hypothetical protein